MVELSASRTEDAAGVEGFKVKLSTSQFELNVFLTDDEVAQLPGVDDARWEDRTSLTLGRCVGAPAHWVSGEGRCDLLIGHDDETWSIGFALPSDIWKRILEAVAVERAR